MDSDINEIFVIKNEAVSGDESGGENSTEMCTSSSNTVPRKRRKIDEDNNALALSSKFCESSEAKYEAIIKDFMQIKCDLCALVIDSLSELQQHFKAIHGEQEAYLMCCNIKYTNLILLTKHIEWHCSPASSTTKNDGSPSDHSVLSTDESFTQLLTTASRRALFNGELFEIESRLSDSKSSIENGGIVAACKFCTHKIRGSLRVTSNFIKHLKTKHEAQYEQYKLKRKHKAQSEQYALKKDPKNSGVKAPLSEDESFIFENTQSQEVDPPINKYAFDAAILKFLISAHLPASIIEDFSFIDLFKGTHLRVASSQTILELLDKKHMEFVKYVSEQLKNVSFLCTTADMWSDKEKSFFGYTCHWIDELTFERKSVALACRRFQKNSSPKMDEMIIDIHKQFDIPCVKVMKTITKNGFNILEIRDNSNLYVDITGFEVTAKENDVDDFEEHKLKFTKLKLDDVVESACYKLTYVATIKFQHILSQKGSGKLAFKHSNVMSRCKRLWNKYREPAAADLIKTTLKCDLVTPKVTHWKSLFESIDQLLRYKSEVKELCTALGIDEITDDDFQYLKQYTVLMTPFANAFKFLQQPEHMYYGYLIAAIVSLKVKLQKLEHSAELGPLKSIPIDLEFEITRQFSSQFNLNLTYDQTAIVAAISCPIVKLKFLPILSKSFLKDHNAEDLKNIFVRHAAEFASPQCENTEEKKPKMSDGFLDFGNEAEKMALSQQQCMVRKQLELYLLDNDCSLNSLHHYPIILKVFLKYNTQLPSSMPVQRLFNFGNLARVPRNQHFDDEYFQKVALLKMNGQLEDA